MVALDRAPGETAPRELLAPTVCRGRAKGWPGCPIASTAPPGEIAVWPGRRSCRAKHAGPTGSGVPAFGEPVQEDNKRPGARLRAMHPYPIGLDESMGELIHEHHFSDYPDHPVRVLIVVVVRIPSRGSNSPGFRIGCTEPWRSGA